MRGLPDVVRGIETAIPYDFKRMGRNTIKGRFVPETPFNTGFN
jgi:hypothetical protein